MSESPRDAMARINRRRADLMIERLLRGLTEAEEEEAARLRAEVDDLARRIPETPVHFAKKSEE